MTQHQVGPESDGEAGLPQEPAARLSAHERLSTGTLARWMRACATHPWRAIVGWIVFVAFCVAVGAVAGNNQAAGSDFWVPAEIIE